MKNNSQHPHRNHPKSSAKESARRAKKLAATAAALGATIGVNMGEVLAGSDDLQVLETDKAVISSQELNKPSVRSPKVERSLKENPSALTEKGSPILQKRPDVSSPKVERQSLQKSPEVQASKIDSELEVQSDTDSLKSGTEGTDINQ